MITFSVSPMSREKIRPSKRYGFKTILRLLEAILKFMEENCVENGTAYISLGNGTPELYLVIGNEVYDFELGDKLSEFAAPYIERGLIGGASLIPASSPEELAAYFNLDKVLRIQRVH